MDTDKSVVMPSREGEQGWGGGGRRGGGEWGHLQWCPLKIKN